MGEGDPSHSDLKTASPFKLLHAPAWLLVIYCFAMPVIKTADPCPCLLSLKLWRETKFRVTGNKSPESRFWQCWLLAQWRPKAMDFLKSNCLVGSLSVWRSLSSGWKHLPEGRQESWPFSEQVAPFSRSSWIPIMEEASQASVKHLHSLWSWHTAHLFNFWSSGPVQRSTETWETLYRFLSHLGPSPSCLEALRQLRAVLTG